MQDFLTENRLFEMYREVTDFEGKERDKTYKKGRNQIDTALASVEAL